MEILKKPVGSVAGDLVNAPMEHSAIAEGSGPEDMIQDLNDLSVLGKANTGAFPAGFDVTKPDTAAVKADEMDDLPATANGDKAEQNESKVIRDKAYTYLKELVDEVREAGKYLFRKDEVRYRGYTSAYRRKKNRSNKSGDEENAE